MSFSTVLLFFIAFRLADWLISYLAPFFIPYLGFFPYKEIAIQYNLPKFLTAFANFDGAHYLLIAKNGYSQYQQAFFPLYPLLIRWLSPLFFNNYLITGLLISNISFLAGLFIFSKYLKQISSSSSKFHPVPTILLLIMFPTSFFFGAVYTEGLFFFLIISCLYSLKKKKFLFASLFAFFAALTKFVGVFLLIPILFTVNRSNESIHWSKKLLLLLSPVVGISLYSLFLFQTTGDPFFFLNSQWAFGAHRSSNIILLPQVYYRYLNIFFTARFNFQYFISVFEFFTFNFVFIIVILNLIQDLLPKNQMPKQVRHDNLGLGLFSLVNLLLPTLTGTFSSIPRYALFSLSFFLYLSQIKNTSIKIAITIIFVISHLIMLSFFSQGYFIS